MVDYNDIRAYSQMEVEDLFEEAKKKREGMENPKLTARDHWNTFLISAIGPGSTLAAAVGYFMYYASGMTTPVGQHLSNAYGKWKEGGGALKNYLNENKSFRRNMRATLLTFAITTIVFMPIVNWLRKPKRIKAENDAIKLTHIERVLKENGYEISFEGRYVRDPHADDHKKETTPPEPILQPEHSADEAPPPTQSNYRENITMERNRPKLQHVSLYMP